MLASGTIAATLISNVATAGIVNAGFEDPIQNVDTWDYSASGWIAIGDAGVFRPATAAYFNGAYAGQQVGFVQSGWVYATGTLRQTSTDVLTVGGVYEFSTMVGRRLDNPLLPWQGFTMSLYAGANLLASVNTPVNPGLGSWERATLQYTASDGSAGLGEFVTIEMTSFYGQTNFDDVSFGLVPAPASAMTLCLGVLPLVHRRR
jgi:hypothetical protein